MSNNTHNRATSKETSTSLTYSLQLDLDDSPLFYYRNKTESEFWSAQIICDPQTGKEFVSADLTLQEASFKQAREALTAYSNWLNYATNLSPTFKECE